ncbi:hypothetical protein T08_3485 [Trichinella sp. T8]|nr:hypothetical protein T08_3485 [Trichinella sp. T8]
MEQRKCENADDTKQIADGTKQIEDDTKQNKRRQSSWDPNSVGLGLGYFERVKLSHSWHAWPLRSTILSSTFSLFGKIGQLQKFEDVSLLCLLTLKIQHSYKTAHD